MDIIGWYSGLPDWTPFSSPDADFDHSGRQYAFNCTVLIASIFGLCLGAPSNYNGILVLTAFVGFGVGGNIPIDTTITLEFLPQVASQPQHVPRCAV